MMHVAKTALISICCLWPISSQGQSLFDLGQESFQSLDTKGGLMSSYIRTFTQDTSGFIWIGAENGLYRFDGYEYRHFKHDPNDGKSIGGDFVYALHATSDGRVWVSTTTTLSVYDPKTETFSHYQHEPDNDNSLINNEINDIFGEASELWIATYEGVDKLDSIEGVFTHFQHKVDDDTSLTDNLVFRVSSLRDGRMAMSTDKGLDLLNPDGKTFEHLHQDANDPKSLFNTRIRSVYQDQEKTIWIGTNKQGIKWITSDGRLHHGHESYKNFPALSTGQIRRINQPNEKEIWLLTFSNGIGVIDRESGRLLRHLVPDASIDTSLNSNYSTSSLADHSGLIWLGHREGKGGINLYNATNLASRMLYYKPNKSNGIDVERINALLETDEGLIWLAGTGINILDPQTGEMQALESNLQEINRRSREGSEIENLHQSPDGRIWMLLQGFSIDSFDPKSGELTSFSEKEVGCELSGETAFDGEYFIWIGCNEFPTIARVDIRDYSVKLYPLDHTGALKFSKINMMAIDHDKTLWIASEHGLFHLPDSHIHLDTKPIQPSGLGQLYASSLLISRSNELWIDTRQGLFHRIGESEPPQFEYINQQIGLPETELFGANMLEDKQGRIWGDKGFFDVTNFEFHKTLPADGFDLSRNWPSASLALRDHCLIFGSYNGLLVIRPKNFQTWQFQPKLVVSKLIVDGEHLPGNDFEKLTLPKSARNISIDVAALDFSSPENIQYRYRLIGFDDNWTYTDAQHRRISYTNLSPGDYVLEVNGTNRRGIWSPHDINILITVLPEWYQTLWAKLLFALLILALIYLISSIRVKRLKANRKVLSKLVKQRTLQLDERNHDLELKQSELSAALNNLLSTQEQLVAQEKMAALGQLVAGVAHEVNTPLGIGVTAASYLRDKTIDIAAAYQSGKMTQTILEKYLDQATKSTDLLQVNLDRAATLITSFKAIAVGQGEEKGVIFDLGEQLQQLTQNLLPMILRRHCKISIDCVEVWYVYGQRSAISQVIANLVDNSLLHAFPGESSGLISITLRGLPNGGLNLVFSDDGVGIPAINIKKVFEPFYTTSHTGSGTGLGLSIVFNLVSQVLNGTITCESKPGAGTSFIINLPEKIASQDANNLKTPLATA